MRSIRMKTNFTFSAFRQALYNIGILYTVIYELCLYHVAFRPSILDLEEIEILFIKIFYIHHKNVFFDEYFNAI